ncbi:hypothetical protein ACIQVU_07840 [Lysinibacillus sp. NPDC098008]|uniref:hypothetical protein n=1 Tax=Lysinibacillus sp. NPDC098008 TaxID=3364146 RepID=UPI0037F17E03
MSEMIETQKNMYYKAFSNGGLMFVMQGYNRQHLNMQKKHDNTFVLKIERFIDFSTVRTLIFCGRNFVRISGNIFMDDNFCYKILLENQFTVYSGLNVAFLKIVEAEYPARFFKKGAI